MPRRRGTGAATQDDPKIASLPEGERSGLVQQLPILLPTLRAHLQTPDGRPPAPFRLACLRYPAATAGTSALPAVEYVADEGAAPGSPPPAAATMARGLWYAARRVAERATPTALWAIGEPLPQDDDRYLLYWWLADPATSIILCVLDRTGTWEELFSPTAEHAVTLEHVIGSWRAGAPATRAMRAGDAPPYLPIDRLLPPIPPAFSGGLAEIPSSVGIQGILAACHNAQEGADRWPRTSAGLPYFAYQQPQGGVTVYLRPPEDTALDQQLAASIWRQVKQLGDDDVDVLLAALAQWMEPSRRDIEGATWITAQAVLDYRGIKPKTKREGRARYRAGHRKDDVAEIADCFARLDRIWVELQQVQVLEKASGRRPRRSTLNLESKLVTITDRITKEETGGERLPIAWCYRPGRWIEPFLEIPNRQVALLLQQALEYDPYHQLWEKRLARYFTFHLRIGATDSAPLRRKVGRMLEELSLPVDRRNPERCRRRFEEAMAHLLADGIIAHWAYTAESRGALEPAKLPARGWLPTWLNVTIEATAPRPLQEHYSTLADRMQLRKDRAAALQQPAVRRGAQPQLPTGEAS